MADAVFAVPGFLGGEISKFAQGRFDNPAYRISLNVCLNAFPNEIGTWVRRPGTQHAGHTRGGGAGRVIKFDFDSSSAVTLEFTDSMLRFRAGTVLIDTNDSATVSAVSTANPAVVTLASAVDWATGDTAMFEDVAPLLQNRQFLVTKSDTTHFALIDALTNVTIDGSTLGTIGTGTMRRLHELTTVYTGGTWSGMRAVQAQNTDILLCPGVAPQALTVDTEPADGVYPQFDIGAAVFLDGPYLDPFTNGVQATPSAKVGIISLALSFPAYDATKAYKEDDFVVYSSVVYQALQSQNVNHQPDISATYWAVSSAAAAINDGQGFLGTDIGRQVRLFSEPAAWAVGSTYAAAAVVSYNPTGLPGATQYWSSKAGGNTGHIPGTDLTWWELAPNNAAIWSWGRITSLSNTIDRALAGSVSLGDMTSGGGLAAAFNGTFSQAASASAEKSITVSGLSSVGGEVVTLSSYVGKNYAAASDQAIQQTTIYPSNDAGFCFGTYNDVIGLPHAFVPTVTFNLRGKASLPASASDGTLLGTSGSIANTFSAVTVVSSNQVTAWKYVWVEMILSFTLPIPAITAYTMTAAVAELSFFNPPGSGVSSGVNVEILGPALLYTTSINTWRLGVYSETTGYPTCGIYYEGRLWLGGAVKNRFDASVSNGIDGDIIDFAPTGFTGAVAASNAISYTLNSNSANQIVDFRADTPGLIACTKAAEFLIQAPTNGPVTPVNIVARQVTNIGSESIPSVRTEHTTVFAKRYGRKLIDYFADANFNKPSGQNLSERAEHILSAGIAELAYATAVTPIIWGRDADGALFGITYKRTTMTATTGPDFAAWHRHELGSDRTVESLCIGPSVGGDLDALTMVTNDADTSIRHVEVLTDGFDEAAALADAWFLDNAVSPSSYTVSGTITNDYPYGSITLNGLWHLNGETVQVFAGGLDLGDLGRGTTGFTDFVVASGSITVPFGDSISSGPGRGLFTAAFVALIDQTQIVIGHTYNSDGQMVRPILPQDTGTRTGPGLGATRRIHQYTMSLCNSRGISVGTTFDADNLKPVLMKKANGNPIADLTTYSGVTHDTLQADYSYDNMIAWRISRPWPANVAALAGNTQSQDR